METLHWLGWVGWLVTAAAWAVCEWRRVATLASRPAASVLPVPVGAPGATRAILHDRRGVIVSERALRGPAPTEFTKPHGKEPATRYRLISTDTDGTAHYREGG